MWFDFGIGYMYRNYIDTDRAKNIQCTNNKTKYNQMDSVYVYDGNSGLLFSEQTRENFFPVYYNILKSSVVHGLSAVVVVVDSILSFLNSKKQ